MVQDVAVHDLLRASGQDHVYFRLHSTDPDADTLEIIWLPEQIPHSDALQLVAKEKTFGLALKRGANGPRYGLRFNTTEAMNAYAVKYSMGEKHKWGRFRASNIPSSVGLRGLHDMLSPLGWTIEEIKFFGDTGAVFLASGRGETRSNALCRSQQEEDSGHDQSTEFTCQRYDQRSCPSRCSQGQNSPQTCRICIRE